MGMVASERVFKVLDSDDHLQPSPVDAYKPSHIRGKIGFENVVFGYNPGNPVLKNVSFTVNPGDTVAIVGHTGSGKTTIISLLNRLYHIQSGEIKIDDVNIEKYEIDTLRKSVGVVLQDVFLFSGSIIDNITLRNPDIPREKVIEAATLIGMHDFIMMLPGNYDFNVMERGATLSLGQRQLLSFIRALLYNPSILILDEATSSVDTESEMMIQNAIDKLITGRTSIVIAHRLSTLLHMDRILVFDQGSIVEDGSHEELLERDGLYKKLWDAQIGGFLIE